MSKGRVSLLLLPCFWWRGVLLLLVNLSTQCKLITF